MAQHVRLIGGGSTLLPTGGGEADVSWSDIEDIPEGLTAAQDAETASIRALGTSGIEAAAGDHTHSASDITATAISPGTATTVQGILGELAARVEALESAQA